MTGLRAISREQRLLGVLTPRAPLGQAGLRLGRQPLDAVLLSGTHGAESVMRIKLEGSPVPTIIRATLRSSSGHRRRGRSWSATRRAGTVSEITQAHEGARCSKVAGNVVALLRAAVQARKRLCRDGSGLRGYRSRACGAAVCSDEECGVR